MSLSAIWSRLSLRTANSAETRPGWRSRFAAHPHPAVLAFLVLYPATLVVIGSRHGPGLSPDSVGYLAAARSFARTGELLTISGEPMTIWPPGLPVMLGTLMRLGVDVEAAAVALNVVGVALSVALTYLLAVETLRSRPLATLCAAIVSVSTSTVGVFTMLWSEPSFVVLTLVALVVLAHAGRRGDIRWWEVVALGVAASLATTIRFVGFTLIPVIALASFVVAGRSRSRIRAVMVGVTAGGLASIGLVAVVVRNVSLGASALGNRSPSGLSLTSVLRASLETVGAYVVPRGPAPLLLAIGVPLALLMSFAVWRALRLKDIPLVILSGFTVAYWVMLWYGQIATRIDVITDRLTAPIFTPMVILAIHGCREWGRALVGNGWWSRMRERRLGTVAVGGGIVALVGTLTFSAILGMGQTWRNARDGNGYNSIAVRESPMGQAIVDLPADTGVAASDQAHAYWISGRRIAPMPQQGRYWTPEDTANATRLLSQRVRQEEVGFLVIFDGYTVITPETSTAMGIEMHLVAAFADGAIYEARPAT